MADMSTTNTSWTSFNTSLRGTDWGEREGGRKRERKGGRERGREGGREGEREGGREGERERGREDGRESQKETMSLSYSSSSCTLSYLQPKVCCDVGPGSLSDWPASR